MEILAIIPARGGSKGLPRKNILPLAGHPLIAYSIKAALESSLVTRVIVSTDNAEIAAISKRYGAEVPFIRPSEISQDMSTDLEVFQHALTWLSKTENYSPDIVIQLRPTSPIRKISLIDECIELLVVSKADSLRIVTPSPTTPYKMWCINKENSFMTPLLTIESIKEPYNEPRQRLPTIYWQIGTLDVICPQVISQQNSMSGKNILPFIVDEFYAVDIDDIDSFKKAEGLIFLHDCIHF